MANDSPKAGRREWIGLAVLALPTLLISIDVFVVLLALPHLSLSLGASSTQQLWILDIYGFMVGGFLITMGAPGDRIGRRRLLLIGATLPTAIPSTVKQLKGCFAITAGKAAPLSMLTF